MTVARTVSAVLRRNGVQRGAFRRAGRGVVRGGWSWPTATGYEVEGAPRSWGRDEHEAHVRAVVTPSAASAGTTCHDLLSSWIPLLTDAGLVVSEWRNPSEQIMALIVRRPPEEVDQ